MGFFKEFKSFLMKGDIVNLSTAVIIGGAFGKIVASFTNDILMPPIGFFLGGDDFKALKIVLQDAVIDANETIIKPAVTINYGNFIQTVLDFVIIGFCIFLVLKAYQKTQKPKEEAPKVKTPTQEELLTEIRDLLKK